MLSHPSLQESRAKYVLPLCLGNILTTLNTYFSSV